MTRFTNAKPTIVKLTMEKIFIIIKLLMAKLATIKLNMA
jgi:hypothetical protein